MDGCAQPPRPPPARRTASRNTSPTRTDEPARLPAYTVRRAVTTFLVLSSRTTSSSRSRWPIAGKQPVAHVRRRADAPARVRGQRGQPPPQCHRGDEPAGGRTARSRAQRQAPPDRWTPAAPAMGPPRSARGRQRPRRPRPAPPARPAPAARGPGRRQRSGAVDALGGRDQRAWVAAAPTSVQPGPDRSPAAYRALIRAGG